MTRNDYDGRGRDENGTDHDDNNGNGNIHIKSDRRISPDNYPNLNPQELEKKWAKELFEKPHNERQILLDELHGVSFRCVEETPELNSWALHKFQDAIDKYIPEYEKVAYNRAIAMNSTYVQSIDFRLKFLRCELFDHRKAALRYLRNLDYLHDKFGDHALMRKLYMSDLNKEEVKFLKAGYIQILPFRDRSGRRIIANLGSYGGFDYSFEVKEKVAAYISCAILSEDVTSQRKGAVSLGLLTADAMDSLLGVKYNGFQRYIQAMPVRYSGCHSCFPDEYRYRFMKALMLTLLEGEMRYITRVHIGTQIECDYMLRSFGIPTDFIPRSFPTGTIKEGQHKKFLKVRMAMDDHHKAQAKNDYRSYYSPSNSTSIKPFPGVECPEVNCYLVRRNGVVYSIPGNIEFRSFLEQKESEKKKLQDRYIYSIAEEVTASMNIRILVFDEKNFWYTEVTKQENLRKHIMRAMRDIRKRKNIQRNPLTLKSSTDGFKGLDGKRSKNDCCAPVPV